MLAFCALASLVSAGGSEYSTATPAPTSVVHNQLFEQIRSDGASERDFIEHEAFSAEQEVDTEFEHIAYRWDHLMQALRVYDVNGSTGVPQLIAVAGTGEVFVIDASNHALLIGNLNVNGTGPDGGVGAAPGMLSSVLAAWSAKHAVSDLFEAKFDEEAQALMNLHVNCPGTLDFDGLAYDFTTGKLIGTTNINASDVEGNSCRFVTVDPEDCTNVQFFNHPYNDRIHTALPFDVDEEVRQSEELCKVPGLAFSPKRASGHDNTDGGPTSDSTSHATTEDSDRVIYNGDTLDYGRVLYGVTYWCDIIRIDAPDVLDSATGSPINDANIIRSLRDGAPDSLPDEHRCKRAGLSYDCLTNQLHLIYHPTFDSATVMHVVIDPETGAVLESGPVAGLPVAALVDEESDARLGYGLASVNCYRMNFVKQEIDRRFGDIRMTTWEQAEELSRLIIDGYEFIGWLNNNETQLTNRTFVLEGNATRNATDVLFDPLIALLTTIGDKVNASVANVTETLPWLNASGQAIASLGPQVQFWIDNFADAGRIVDAFTHDEMLETRESLLDQLTRLRADVEARHKAIMGTTVDLKECVFENGEAISVQLRRLEAAYDDNDRFNDDDDDDLGYGSSDFLDHGKRGGR